MTRTVTCLLVILLSFSIGQAATYRPFRTASIPVSVKSDHSIGLSFIVKLQKQHSSIKFLSACRRYLAPDGAQKTYRAARWELSIAAFIFGIIGVFIPVVGVIFSIAAIALGILAIHKRAQYRGLAIAGLILGVLGIVVLVAGIMLAGSIL